MNTFKQIYGKVDYASPCVRTVAISSAQPILNCSVAGGEGMLQSMTKVATTNWQWDEN